PERRLGRLAEEVGHRQLEGLGIVLPPPAGLARVEHPDPPADPVGGGDLRSVHSEPLPICTRRGSGFSWKVEYTPKGPGWRILAAGCCSGQDERLGVPRPLEADQLPLGVIVAGE